MVLAIIQLHKPEVNESSSPTGFSSFQVCPLLHILSSNSNASSIVQHYLVIKLFQPLLNDFPATDPDSIPSSSILPPKSPSLYAHLIDHFGATEVIRSLGGVGGRGCVQEVKMNSGVLAVDIPEDKGLTKIYKEGVSESSTLRYLSMA